MDLGIAGKTAIVAAAITLGIPLGRCGTPEEVAEVDASYTGKYLKEKLR